MVMKKDNYEEDNLSIYQESCNNDCNVPFYLAIAKKCEAMEGLIKEAGELMES